MVGLRVHQRIYHAPYSDVFRVEQRIYRLFRDSPDPNLRNRTSRLFEAQCEAYRLAQSDPVLKWHIPIFYGQSTVTDVLDEHDESIVSRYMLDRCYSISFLEGEEEKVITCPRPEVKAIRERFRQLDINTGDASVFVFREAMGFALIDFDMENY
jgi:hypothetical protein